MSARLMHVEHRHFGFKWTAYLASATIVRSFALPGGLRASRDVIARVLIDGKGDTLLRFGGFGCIWHLDEAIVEG